MQSPVRRQVVGGVLGGLALCVGLVTAPGAVDAQTPAPRQAAQVRIRAEIPAGTHKSLRLRNVPAEARVAFAVQASSRITLSLLTEADARRYPDVTEAIFTAPVERTLSFSVALPVAGNYYVVFDNRKGDTASQVQMVFRAARGSAVESPARPSPPVPAPPPTDAPSRLRQSPGMHEM